jgi:hypothetical protein
VADKPGDQSQFAGIFSEGDFLMKNLLTPPVLTRRDALKYSSLALLPLALPSSNFAFPGQQPMTANGTQQTMTANGGPDPYPIPWLDKNGSHNQPAGLNLEPSHIYHFNGRVARCSTFTGIGTDNHGNRIAFGSPTTDYGVMQGEYWAARTAQRGTFTHI